MPLFRSPDDFPGSSQGRRSAYSPEEPERTTDVTTINTGRFWRKRAFCPGLWLKPSEQERQDRNDGLLSRCRGSTAQNSAQHHLRCGPQKTGWGEIPQPRRREPSSHSASHPEDSRIIKVVLYSQFNIKAETNAECDLHL